MNGEKTTYTGKVVQKLFCGNQKCGKEIPNEKSRDQLIKDSDSSTVYADCPSCGGFNIFPNI